MFNITRSYDAKYLHRWTKPKRRKAKSKRWTRGEYGRSFIPINDHERVKINELTAIHNYNLYASDQISVRRNLLDYRAMECRDLAYPKRLPTVSVIIILYNEAWSMILRTVWSIIDRSPPELLREIILVDDASTMESLKRPLDDYIDTFPANVSIIRNERREGLIRARLIGAEKATVRNCLYIRNEDFGHFSNILIEFTYREVSWYFWMHTWNVQKVGLNHSLHA